MPNTARTSAPAPETLAVHRIWDAARVALMARYNTALAFKSGASPEQLAQATDAMSDAFNSLLVAVREFDTCTPLLPNDTSPAATCRLLTS